MLAPSSESEQEIGAAPASNELPELSPADANKIVTGLGLFTAVLIFILIWMLIGFIAFIYSIICFWKSGTTFQHILGFLIACFFGPFYFFYYKFVPGYCNTI